MQKYTKEVGVILRHLFVKPLLKENHRIRRLKFILNRLEPVGNGVFRIKKMNNEVHFDEKWFYMTRKDRTIREFEKGDHHADQTTRHKSHIEKVMFLAAVGVPQQ